MALPTVCLVGRPNVGKSTLFNKIAGEKIAIVEDIPGVTRDRLYQEVSFQNHRFYLIDKFYLIDTGGIDETKNDFNKEIKIQAELAIEEADVIVFIVDGKEGLTSNDLVVRDILRKSKKRVIVAINKIDTKQAQNNLYDFAWRGAFSPKDLSAVRWGKRSPHSLFPRWRQILRPRRPWAFPAGPRLQGGRP